MYICLFPAERLVVDTSPTRFNHSAALVSPVFNRSRDWYSNCLKFRYMLRGPGKKRMTIYHKTNEYRQIPIWISKRNTGKNWVYGQVSLSSVSKFQVGNDAICYRKIPWLFVSAPPLNPSAPPGVYCCLLHPPPSLRIVCLLQATYISSSLLVNE